MINILIVDDSETEIQMLKHLLASEDDLHVVGCARNGKEAIHLVETLKPDIITMDLQMPIMDGLEAIKIIMAKHPTPIVVISSHIQNSELQMTFKALEVGALSVLEKPCDITSAQFKETSRRMIDVVRAMSEIKVVTRRYPAQSKSVRSIISSKIMPAEPYEIIAIGSSVGGPQVLRTILSDLPATFNVPIVIVQHMTPGFMTGFVKWLNENSKLCIKEAVDSEALTKGVVYFAPDSFHLEVIREQSILKAKLVKAAPVSGFCPSVTVLLKSVTKACHKRAVGVLLTGMGNDGAQGLLELKNAKGHTLIQDKESAVVFGMAGVAQALGAVDKVVEVDKIASYLRSITVNS